MMSFDCNDESDHYSCANLAVKFIKIAGLWPTSEHFSVRNCVYKLYYVMVFLIQLYYFFGLTIQLFFVDTVLEETFEIIIFLITEVHILYKTRIFYFMKKEILSLLGSLRINFVIHKEFLTTENKQIIHSTAVLTRNMCLLYAIMINGGITFYCEFVPIATSVYDYCVHNESNILPRKPPYSIWLPIDMANSDYYIEIFLMLTLASHCIALVLMSTQAIFLTLIICLAGQFELLSDALRNLSKNVQCRLQSTMGSTKWKSKELEEDASYSDEPTDLFLAEAEIYLKECIKHHQSLIEFAEKFDNVWKTTFFVQFLTASFLVCFLGFQAMLMPFGLNLIKMLIFIFVELFELGVACKFGSDLMTQSEDVYRAVYDSDWYNQSTRFKQSARMLIMRAQKPVRLTAGRLGILSQPLFAAILRSSYSYLALLRQMHDD
ncbi:Odorant receptor 50d [Blattella germanica]|nr:Odorant receptor 50d [Blattella germanica]